MALCSMCFQQRNVAPLYVGGPPPVKVAESVCRGCTMGIEKALNYISFRGFIIDLVRAPHLWSDAVDASLRGEGEGLGVPEASPDRAARADEAVPIEAVKADPKVVGKPTPSKDTKPS